MGENLESLTDEELGDKIDETQRLIQTSCATGYSELCHSYRQKIMGYWNEQHRRQKG